MAYQLDATAANDMSAQFIAAELNQPLREACSKVFSWSIRRQFRSERAIAGGLSKIALTGTPGRSAPTDLGVGRRGRNSEA